jgi:hypothetical protein
MNEAAALEGIETERAKRRPGEAGKPAVSGRTSQKARLRLDTVSEKGRATAAIGKKIDVSQDTADKALKVKKAVDALKEQGKTQEAEQVVATLHKQGFHSAYKQVQEKGPWPLAIRIYCPASEQIFDRSRKLKSFSFSRAPCKSSWTSPSN